MNSSRSPWPSAALLLLSSLIFLLSVWVMFLLLKDRHLILRDAFGWVALTVVGGLAVISVLLAVRCGLALRRRRGLAVGDKGLALVAIAMLSGVVAWRQFAKPRVHAAPNTCLANLKQLDGAKQQWAIENRKGLTDTPTWGELLPYLNNVRLVCPAHGSYTLNAVGEDPACSIPEHHLKRRD